MLAMLSIALPLVQDAMSSILNSNSTNSTNDEAKKVNDKGLALGHLGQYKEAITYFDKVLSVEPNSTDALNNKGLTLDHLGKHEEAITYYDKARTEAFNKLGK
jgi:tetratricopeptide (TPR) repeat protein